MTFAFTVTDQKAVGNLVRRLREDRHTSIEAVSQATGYSIEALSDVEAGRLSRISEASLYRIGDSLDAELIDQLIEAGLLPCPV